MKVEVEIDFGATKVAGISGPAIDKDALKAEREIVARTAVQLNAAATILINGRISAWARIRHQFSRILDAVEQTDATTRLTLNLGETAAGDMTLPSATLVHSWKRAVDRLVPMAHQVPCDEERLPTFFRRYVGELIKQGKKLCAGGSSVAGDAQVEIEKAEQLYAELTGDCFVQVAEGEWHEERCA